MIMQSLVIMHLWSSLQFSDVRDGEAKEEVHEDEGHDQDEDEEEDLGDERGALGIDEVCSEVKFSHQHCQHLKDDPSCHLIVSSLWWRHFRGFQKPGCRVGERGRWGRMRGTRWRRPWRRRRRTRPPVYSNAFWMFEGNFLFYLGHHHSLNSNLGQLRQKVERVKTCSREGWSGWYDKIKPYQAKKSTLIFRIWGQCSTPVVKRSKEQRDLFVASSNGTKRKSQAKEGWATSRIRLTQIVPVIIFQQILKTF